MPATKLAAPLPPFAIQEISSLMLWIAPSEKDPENSALEERLWHAAKQFSTDSCQTWQEYSAPVLGLIFRRRS